MEILAYTRQHTNFSRALAKHSFTREVENRSIRSAGDCDRNRRLQHHRGDESRSHGQ
jgi:hypothetical protein